uniref:lysosomal Pro-X carboxypeptidase-like n=1 Tax=Erigeron canadensis TaxID=72917 RepID=UPI001CB8C8F4|nr:lysosomal Pro-X carboxypeptidase-like [Erigeron canadensis]
MAKFDVFLFKLSLVLFIEITSLFGKSFRTQKLDEFSRIKTTKGSPVSNSNSLEYNVYNYTQTLDHFNFNPDSYMTFQQRYIVVNKYWGGPTNSSPIFVYTGERVDIIEDVKYGGFPSVLASRFNALLLYVEQRYYGTSMPFGSKEEAYKNATTLGYFTTEQTLADYAQLIINVKKNMSAEHCPVIFIGASLGGIHASWFRLKYPHIAYGAYASSTPILYFPGLGTPENGFSVIVSNNFNTTSNSCYNTIRESWFEIDRVSAQPDGLSSLSQMFNTCMPLNTSKDLKINLEARYNGWAGFDDPASNYLQLFCNATDEGEEKTYILNKIINGFVAIRGQRCINIVDFSPQYDSGWDWQSCTEMVIPTGRGENDTMFQADPFDLEDYTKECQQVFGITPRPYQISLEFGGYGIKTVLERFASNIIFSNGLRDPYSSGGVLQNISDSVLAINTLEGNHALDMNTPIATDPDWLIVQRDTVINVIQGWLSKYVIPN